MTTKVIPIWRAIFGAEVIFIVAGCSSTQVSGVGDATLKITHRCTAFDVLVGLNYIDDLQFPEVSLSQPGEHVFHVRGLSRTVFPDSVLLRYPVFHSLSFDDYRVLLRDARVLVEFRDTYPFPNQLVTTNCLPIYQGPLISAWLPMMASPTSEKTILE